MSLHARRVGANLVYFAGHQKRIIDAIGPDVVKWCPDRWLVPSADAPLGWTVTLVEAGAGETTVARTDAVNGALLIITDVNENDGANLQLTGEAFEFSSDQRLVYARCVVSFITEVTQNDFLFGICITDTDLLGGMTDGVYFRKVDGSAALAAVTEKDSVETETTPVVTLVADTTYELEFYFDGVSVEFFVNGLSVAKHTTNIPNDELLTPSFQFLSGSAGAKALAIRDDVRFIQVGR